MTTEIGGEYFLSLEDVSVPFNKIPVINIGHVAFNNILVHFCVTIIIMLK